ncbi:hypothetical protein KAR91_36605 [Candidatus Pacearchaeota archaeon]|nr:hypothetical protein [Candidatus Pacearchaeota archaeon]
MIKQDQIEQWYDLRDGRVFSNRPPKNYPEWENAVYALAAMRKNNPCWVGDMLNIGEDLFGERYAQALDEFGLHNAQVIANYKSTMKNVPASSRRKSLYFSHYKSVTSYSPQEQMPLLAWCDKLDLKTSDFGRVIKKAKAEGTPIEELIAMDAAELDDWMDDEGEAPTMEEHFMAHVESSINSISKALEFCDDKPRRDLLMTAKDAVLDAKEISARVEA